MAFTLKITGGPYEVDVDGDTPLVWVLRDVPGMTGTKLSCSQALCACTAHVDGQAVRSCQTPVDSIGDSAVTPIETIDQAPQGAASRDSAYALSSTYWRRSDGSKPNCGHAYTVNFRHAGATAPVRARGMAVDSVKAR